MIGMNGKPAGVPSLDLLKAELAQLRVAVGALRQENTTLLLVIGLGLAISKETRGAWALPDLGAFHAAHVVRMGAGAIQPPAPPPAEGEAPAPPPAPIPAIVVEVKPRAAEEDRPKLRVVRG